MACKRSAVRSRLAPPISSRINVQGPHRLEAKDSALSRRQQGFESPWGRQQIKRAARWAALFIWSSPRGLRTPGSTRSPGAIENVIAQRWRPEGRSTGTCGVIPWENRHASRSVIIARLNDAAAVGSPFLLSRPEKGMSNRYRVASLRDRLICGSEYPQIRDVRSN